MLSKIINESSISYFELSLITGVRSVHVFCKMFCNFVGGKKGNHSDVTIASADQAVHASHSHGRGPGVSRVHGQGTVSCPLSYFRDAFHNLLPHKAARNTHNRAFVELACGAGAGVDSGVSVDASGG